MFGNGFSALDVFVDDQGTAVGVGLEPETDEGVDEAKIDGAVEGQMGLIAEGCDVACGVEVFEDDVFACGTEAEHFGFETGPAGALSSADAVVDGQVAAGVPCLSAAVVVEGAA